MPFVTGLEQVSIEKGLVQGKLEGKRDLAESLYTQLRPIQ